LSVHRRVLTGFVCHVHSDKTDFLDSASEHILQCLEDVQVIDWNVGWRHKGAEHGIALCFLAGRPLARSDLHRVAAAPEAQVDFGSAVGGHNQLLGKPSIPMDT
jgi:hypothetical protein